MLCQTDSFGVNRRDGAVSSKAHAQRLCQAVHGIGRIHAGAGAAGRAGLFFKFLQFLHGHGSCSNASHRFKHGGKACFMSAHMSRQHGAAGNKNSGDIDSCGSHQKAGNVLVAVGDHYQAVKTMGHGHTFRAVTDQISCYQGIFHADVSHGDAVAYGDGGEYNGGAAGHGNAHFYRFHNFIQVHMPRNDFIIGADNTDEGTLSFLFRYSQRIKQTSVGCLLHSCFYRITSHSLVSPFGFTAVIQPSPNCSDLYSFCKQGAHFTAAYFFAAFGHDIRCSVAVLKHLFYGVVHRIRFRRQVKAVAQHHGCA